MAEHLTIPGALEWDAVERHSIATLRYAGGKEHDVKYVSEVAYDAAVAELKALVQELSDENKHLCGVIDKVRARRAKAYLIAREAIRETRRLKRDIYNALQKERI